MAGYSSNMQQKEVCLLVMQASVELGPQLSTVLELRFPALYPRQAPLLAASCSVEVAGV